MNKTSLILGDQRQRDDQVSQRCVGSLYFTWMDALNFDWESHLSFSRLNYHTKLWERERRERTMKILSRIEKLTRSHTTSVILRKEQSVYIIFESTALGYEICRHSVSLLKAWNSRCTL